MPISEKLTKTSFTPARLALHWAAQIPSAAGATLLPPQEDASHTALAWDDEHRALVSAAGVTLLVESLVVVAGDVSIPLAGLTLNQAIARVGDALGKGPLTRPEHALPDHPVGEGAPFEAPNEAALREIARWYANAAGALHRFGQVRCWPHHFDIAALVVLDATRSIGIGMSPGDTSYDEPYFYVTPYPFDESATLPSVAPGEWRASRWRGAVLRGSVLVAEADQHAALERFLDAGANAGRAISGSLRV